MPTNLDLNLLPLVRTDGQDRNDLPGLLMVTPPKRSARGRDEDRLILYFSMQGNSPLSREQIDQILGSLARTYYKTAGSVTSALRTTADVMNTFLLDRNLKSSSGGKQCIGLLALGVLREQKFTLGTCGPIHSFLLSSQETLDWYDPNASGRGMGLARALSVRFFQAELSPNSYLIISPQPPSSWTPSSLQNAFSQGIESLRRKLLSQAGQNVSALMIQPVPGSGKLRLMRAKPPAQMVKEDTRAAVQEEAKTREEPKPTTPAVSTTGRPEELQAPAAAEEPEKEQPVIELPEDIERLLQPASSHKKESTLPPAPVVPSEVAEHKPAGTPVRPTRPPVETKSSTAAAQPAVEPKEKKSDPVQLKLPNVDFAPVGKVLAPVGNAAKSTGKAAAGLTVKILKTILPDDTIFSMPAPTMAFIAIAIAVMMSAAGITVYWQRGRAIEYQKYYELALQNAAHALEQTDTAEVRLAWEATVDYLDQAQRYQITDDSQNLHTTALNALDELDAIRRLHFEPALVGGLGADALITRMAATSTDLFMLNANSGSVYRAQLIGSNYEIDPNFECGPNPIIGPIKDIALLPRSNSATSTVTVLGLDVNNQLVFCSPGKPASFTAPAAPQLGWINPVGFTLDSGSLYILDPNNKSVWFYRSMNTGSQPHLFFGNDVPDSIQAAIDITVSGDRLYLLHEDSHVSQCTYSGLDVAPTRCSDPMAYDDSRPGRSDTPVILDARFTQIFYSQPPNPSLYMLDPVHHSVYLFSLQLALQEQYRPSTTLGNEVATAFTVNPDHILFLAVKNQIYMTMLP